MSPPDYSFEEALWTEGKIPAGVDEAGRGPLAGPVVAAAVILPIKCTLINLDDSKKITPEKRVIILEQIEKLALATAVGVIDSALIDKMNILRAAILAMEKAVKHLDQRPDFLLIDGNVPTKIPIPQETIVKGDSRCCSIAAASILAKVTRDKIMNDYHLLYPHYNFMKNKGYPTKEHLEAIRRFGPSPIHRKTFRGVLKF